MTTMTNNTNAAATVNAVVRVGMAAAAAEDCAGEGSMASGGIED